MAKEGIEKQEKDNRNRLTNRMIIAKVKLSLFPGRRPGDRVGECSF
jgi:hypothetical protein